MTRVSPGVYRGRVHVGGLTGLFRIRPLNETRDFPEVGLYRQESEMTDYGSNQALLRSISEATGGRFNPPLNKAFDPAGHFTDSTMRLWPGLLAIAVLLNLIELALRKWRGTKEYPTARESARNRQNRIWSRPGRRLKAPQNSLFRHGDDEDRVLLEHSGVSRSAIGREGHGYGRSGQRQFFSRFHCRRIHELHGVLQLQRREDQYAHQALSQPAQGRCAGRLPGSRPPALYGSRR